MGKRQAKACQGCNSQIKDIKKHIKNCQSVRKKNSEFISFVNGKKLCLICFSYSSKLNFNKQHNRCLKNKRKILRLIKKDKKKQKAKKIKVVPVKLNLRYKPKVQYKYLTKNMLFQNQMRYVKNRKIQKTPKQKKPNQIKSLTTESSNKINIVINSIQAPIYLVCDENLDPIMSKNEKVPVKIASLTKLFNLVTCLKIAKQHSISLETIFEVPKLSIRRTQTNAGLRQGDKLSLNDLIYAMLLPSGGDAAETIAIVLGKYLIRSKKVNIALQRQAYIKKMNQTLTAGMQNTIFVDEKGYGQNFSTAEQIIKVLKQISQNKQAFQFLKVYRHRTTVVSKFNIKKLFVWNSTNILIHNRFYGKTGTTTGYKFAYAGIKEQNGKKYYFCVLQHLSHTGRFTDVKEIFQKLIKNK